MTQIDAAWGAGPGPDYEQLAERFRPLFARIAENAVQREVNRELPYEQVDWLKTAGFTALRVPKEYGGSGVSLPELFALLIELGQADSNVQQAIRGHLGFVEGVLNSPDASRRERWLKRIGDGETVGPAYSEAGAAKREAFDTKVYRNGDHWILEGTKFYTTGALFSEWVDVGATDPEGNRVRATVRRDAPGVELLDDWNGFGQTLSASGTGNFHEVLVDAEEIGNYEQFRYSPGFYQLFHLANLAGLGRALTGEVANAVAKRQRTFSIGNADRVSQDPQILAVVGKVRSAAYCAGAIVLKNAEALQRAFELRFSTDKARQDKAVEIAELELGQALTPVSDLIIDAASQIFDALGASSTLRELALDRFWRNARTLASHNPRVYKERIVGDYAVNGTPPPEQWKIGVA